MARNQKQQTPPIDSGDAAMGELGNRIRQMRADRSWSLEVLSNASGVSRSMLSEIERNQANPTLVVTMRIARAFGVTLGELVEAPAVSSSVQVIRRGDRAQIYRSDNDCQIRTLSPLQLEKDVEFYEVQLQAGSALRSAPHFEGTREFLIVEKGRIRVESGTDSEELVAGDSATYRADVQHAIVNIGKGEALIFLVDIYR
ncbi:MAG: helix-turn-helix domain protein [Chthoniobacteraceae bacterium]|nr:helix-turn-helix domain protein [Chthoniobacteraceae bacterium]